MTRDYILMTRAIDSSRQNMPTIQLVDTDCPDHWLILTGTDLMRREAEAKKELQPTKRYRVTIEEIPE